MVDNNQTELKALECMKNGEGKKGLQLQRDFLEEIKKSEEDLCSCKNQCPYHGKCIDCVMIHRGHGDHLPNCFRQMVNKMDFSFFGFNGTFTGRGFVGGFQ